MRRDSTRLILMLAAVYGLIVLVGIVLTIHNGLTLPQSPHASR
jgi:hypothetical protein